MDWFSELQSVGKGNAPAIGGRPATGPVELQKTSVWSFPERGAWGSHNGRYRGNWSPHVPRNLILRYTDPGDRVLDPMVGGGTTMVECLLLGRNGIGVDVNPAALVLAESNVRAVLGQAQPGAAVQLFHGDATELTRVESGSIDLVTLHPPYANIIRYSDGAIGRDLSSLGSLEAFFLSIARVASECYRVLRPGKHCAVLMGDTRKHGHVVPLSIRLFNEFLEAGFAVREHIVKLQWNTLSERTTWKSQEASFLMLAHENLFVFRKPEGREDSERVRASRYSRSQAADERAVSHHRPKNP